MELFIIVTKHIICLVNYNTIVTSYVTGVGEDDTDSIIVEWHFYNLTYHVFILCAGGLANLC